MEEASGRSDERGKMVRYFCATSMIHGHSIVSRTHLCKICTVVEIFMKLANRQSSLNKPERAKQMSTYPVFDDERGTVARYFRTTSTIHDHSIVSRTCCHNSCMMVEIS
jgi:dTDP-4-dehydrorhamnose 3,5-epimerase-like enzyme